MPTLLKTIPLCLAATLMASPMITPAEASHQNDGYYRYNDPYSPSTPNLYRRERRTHECQLPSHYQNKVPANRFQGWLMPSLIWGDCPLVMPPLIRARENSSSPFGSLNW